MRMATQTDIARAADMSLPTVNKLIRRGVLPPPDMRAGRLGYYSEHAEARIMQFLLRDYVAYKRYPPGQVRLEKEGSLP